MKKRYVLFLIPLLPLITMAQSIQQGLFDQYTRAHASVYDFSGAVLVAKNGKIIYTKAFGEANREWKIPNTVHTRFPIASLTKQFTAVAILQLAEQGKLTTGDRLSKYYPGFPKADSITIHMLLNHTAGIKEISANPLYFDLNPNRPIEAMADTVLINMFKDQPFDFAPGTFWRYSNSGYILLGYIIEKVSGLSYRDFVRKYIFQKAGMVNSDLYRFDSIIPYRASGYSRTNNDWINGKITPVNNSFSAGGLFATADDLFKYTRALSQGKLINTHSLAQMNRPNHLPNGYGYGVFIDSINHRQAIFHSGDIPGFGSYMISYPAEQLTIILLTNRDSNLDFISKGIAAIAFNQPVLIPYKHQARKINPAILKKYTGVYEGPALPFPLTLTEQGGKLFLRLHRDIELVPESETKFFINEPDVDIQLEFVLTPQQQSKKLFYIEGGIKNEMIRR